MKKIKQLPVPVAVLIMIVCILAGLTFGNNNALSRAMADSSDAFGSVQSMGQEWANKASNISTLCTNAGVDDGIVKSLNNAIDAVKKADSPKRFTQAREDLLSSLDKARTALDEHSSEVQYLQRAEDDLLSSQLQLDRVIKTYNAEQQTVVDVYNKLPTKWLLKKPEVIA